MKIKFFSKKKAPRKVPKKTPRNGAGASAPEQSFYTESVGDKPLDEFSGGPGRTRDRTSLQSPARRRETSNRTSTREIFILLFRAGLIVVLLAGGFVGLKLVLGRFAGPTEKEKALWEVNAELMKKGAATSPLSVEPASEQPFVQIVDAELMENRLKMWNEAERYFRSAEALARRDFDKEAVVRLGQVLRVVPDSHSGQHLLMEIQMRSENYAQAVPLCLRLLDQDSQQWDVKMALLQALQKLNQPEACLALAHQMLEAEPNNVEVLKLAAFAHRAAGHLDKALTLFDRMLENDSRNLAALEGSGAIHQELGEWQKAISYYLELVRTQSRVEYYHELARCYARQGEGGKAVIFLGQAASLYGEPEVSSWLRKDLESFDPIRDAVEYRAFADRMLGEGDRKAIERIRKRVIHKQKPKVPDSPAPIPALEINEIKLSR